MRRIFLFGLLASFFIFGKAFSANQRDVVINEVAWMGSPSSTADEWIELYNNTGAPINLFNWTLSWYRSSATTTISLAKSIEPLSFFLLERTDENSVPGITADQIYKGSNSSLNNDGEVMELRDEAGILIDYFDCFTKWFAGDNNKFTMSRIDSASDGDIQVNWKNSEQINGTPKAQNFSVGTTPTTTLEVEETTLSLPPVISSPSSPPPLSSLFFSLLKINEFVSNPTTGNEWVELYNPTSEAVDIAGGYICDSRVSTSTCKPLTGAVEASGRLFFDLLTDSYLNNDGDSVILKNSAGAVVDRVDYGEKINPEKGESLARKADGADTDNISDWVVTTQSTPGAANIITVSAGEEKKEIAPPTSTVVKKNSTPAPAKPVGLKWKVKYDPRVRQNIETSFSASTTLDPRGGRISYSWNFGDKIISGPEVKYVFATSGAREVIISATSTAGTIDQKKIKIIIYPEKEIWGAGVVFSEILPNNLGEDEAEYARIKNITSSTINISNWKLAYNNDVYQIPTSTSILAGDYLTFYKIITGFTLNNSGGQILLLNDNNELIDQVEYGKSKEGDVYVFDGENCPDCQSGSRSLREKRKSEPASTNIVKTPATTSAKSAKKIVYKGYSSAGLSQARDFEKGQQIKVRGVVSVLPGNFGVQFFYIADGESGIQIYQYKKDFPKLAVGDLVEVKGTISVANDTKRINIKSAKDIDILSIGNSVFPASSSIETLAEENIGGLVKISGEITEIKSNLMYVDDGSTEAEVYFKNNAKIDKKKFKEGEMVEIAGVLEKGKNGLQIWPRSNADITSLGPSQDLIDKQVAAEKATSGDAAEKYLTATAGGLTTLLLAFLARARGLLIVGGLKKIVSLGAKIIRRG